MIEAEWLTREDPEDMLRFIKQHRGMQRKEKQRRQRLFSVACCRRIWPLIDNDRSRESVEVAERFSDGRATSEELRDAEAGASADWSNGGGNDALFACVQVCWKTVDGMHVSTTTIGAAYEQQQRKTGKPVDILGGRKRGACPPEEREQCRILRCIFGNPFRPVFIDSAWQTGTIISLAQGIYDDRAYDRLPILADALEEAGCTNAEILAHCRSEGPHFRGCWVVDVVLGKK